MSRNVGQKNKKPPARQQRRRRISDTTSASSIDLSDDGGYSAVEEVTDSEDDDEEDVDAAEEEHIITDALHPQRSTSSPRPVQDDAEDADEEDDDDEDEEDVEDVEDVEDASSWNGILSEVDSSASSQQHVEDAFFYQDTPVVERHVRFAGVPDSDSDSTTSDATDHNGDFFPDIFVEQTALDPAFRREVEEDPDDSSNSGSFWDFQGAYEAAFNSFPVEVTSDDETPMPTPMASQAASEVCSPVVEADEYQELDGYETDGETTEEDIPPEPATKKKQVRRVRLVECSDSDTEKPTKPSSRGKPRVGRFHLDSSDNKPIAVVNPITRKMMIFTPQRMRRLDLSPESFNLDPQSFQMDQYFGTPGGMTEASPILSNSGTMMFGAMFASNTFGDFINTQPIGPEEAFFPTAGSGAFPGTDSEFSEMDEIEEDEAEKQLKIEDFLTLSDDDSGDQGDDDGANGWDEETNDDLASTPGRTPGRRPSTAVSTTSDANMDVHPLLAHFDGNSGAVGAFRRNQVNQQLILSDKATKESLLFSNNYSMGTLRGVRSDSLGTVAAPLTPARRRKRDMTMFDHINSSPLDSVSQKRKASATISEASNHKRHRSISDVQALQI